MTPPSTPDARPLELQHYVSLGLPLVLWTPSDNPNDNGKGPHDGGWPTKSYSIDDYRPGMQVGVKLGAQIADGRYLVDVDFDWAEPINWIAKFFENTGLSTGRASKKVSHAFYTVTSPIPSKSFKDINGEMLFEIRCTAADGSIGLQTLMPPSIHRASGERIMLNATGGISHSVTGTFQQSYLAYGCGCLLGRHWPPNGDLTPQHDAAGCAAGLLCALGLDPRHIPIVICMAATLGRDSNPTDRETYANNTVTKFTAGQRQLSGEKRLTEIMGEAVIKKLYEWFAELVAPDISRLNERYAVISYGASVVVMENDADGGVANLWAFPEFKKLLCKDRITINGRTRPLADVWLAHPKGRRYDKLVYAMPGSEVIAREHDYNGYLGFTVKPAKGEWSKTREHIRQIVCRGNERNFHWMLNWMADLFQRPGRHSWSALVFIGAPGTGKGYVAHHTIGRCFYRQQYAHINGPKLLTGTYNKLLSGKCFIYADESTWGGDPKAVNRLKGLVTEDTLIIEPKFIDAVEEPSSMHIVIASNDEWPIAVEDKDRRYSVHKFDESHRQDHAYFRELLHELENGGRAAMLYDLLDLKVDEDALRNPPGTEAKQDLAIASLGIIDEWWFELITSGDFPVACRRTNSPHAKMPDWSESAIDVNKDSLYGYFVAHLERRRHYRPISMVQFWKHIRELVHVTGDARLCVDSRRIRVVTLPRLDECRNAWLKKMQWEEFEWNV